MLWPTALRTKPITPLCSFYLSPPRDHSATHCASHTPDMGTQSAVPGAPTILKVALFMVLQSWVHEIGAPTCCWVQGQFTLTPVPQHFADEASTHKCPCPLHLELWVRPHQTVTRGPSQSWAQPWIPYYQQCFSNHSTYLTRGPSWSSEVHLRGSPPCW